MKQEVKTNNKRRLYLIMLILGILIISGVGVLAFSDSGTGDGTPSVMGHSGDELLVDFRDSTKTINEALNEIHDDAVALDNQLNN